MAKKKYIIIKVQAAQFPYHQDFLVYNKDRSIEYTMPFDQKFFDDAMGGEEKAYLLVTMKKDGELLIDKRVEEQDW